jgi:D-tyrosyl-tRNA(Tyr) deacylase
MSLLTPSYAHDVDIEIEQGGDFYLPLGIIATQLAVTGPAVARNTVYAVGDRVTPLAANGYAYACSTAGTSHASNEPTWPTVVGKTVSDGTVTWTNDGSTSNRDYLVDTTSYTAVFEVRQGDSTGDTQVEASTTDARITVGYTPAKWAIGTAYTVGQQVVPLLLNGYIYECTVAGTSHAGTEPTWPTTLGQTVLDNTARWRCELAETVTNGLVSNITITIVTAVTELLTDWNRGVYTLQVVDTFGHTVLWMDGIARLRVEATY